MNAQLDTLPAMTRTYRNRLMDSGQWQHYEPRRDDVLVCTSYKSGTTLMQAIVLQLLHLNREVPSIMEASPWVEFRHHPSIEQLRAALDQSGRRCIKSHVPLDGIPYYPEARYVVVGRDARDVFMSWYNHYSNFTDDALAQLNGLADPEQPPFPRCPEDVREYWRTWITTGAFEWESEGYPHSGNLHHTKMFWSHRHLDNILLVHYADLLARPVEEIERVAAHIGVEITRAQAEEVAGRVAFDTVKANPRMVGPAERMNAIWKGGSDTFINRGTNGRWRGVLSPEDLALYEAAKQRVLDPDCARWLEQGRAALRTP